MLQRKICELCKKDLTLTIGQCSEEMIDINSNPIQLQCLDLGGKIPRLFVKSPTYLQLKSSSVKDDSEVAERH